MVLRVKSSRCALYGSGHTSQQAAEGRRDSRTPGLAKDSVSRAQKPATSNQYPVTRIQDPEGKQLSLALGLGLGFRSWDGFIFSSAMASSRAEMNC